ncbi:MAG: phosphopantetheine-binding protein [Gilvibacter sp.]
MESQEIIETLKNIIEPYVQNIEAFKTLDQDTDFINDLGINSANLVDVVLDVEDAFDIVIDNESMEKMLDVRSSMAVIQQKLAAK